MLNFFSKCIYELIDALSETLFNDIIQLNFTYLRILTVIEIVKNTLIA